MELLLLGWALGLATRMAHHRFVVKPELEKAIAELEALRND
jgi:hypothetical protein